MDDREVPQSNRGSVDNISDLERKETEKALTQLRIQVHAQQRQELEERIKTNPQQTEEEQRLGVYIEEIEPQVRQAVLEFCRKGYSTFSSGFFGHNSELQTIEGHFRLDDETRAKLAAMGVEAKVEPSWKYHQSASLGETPDIPEDSRYITTVQFRPTSADLQEIERQWRQVADAMPDRGTPAQPDWAMVQNRARKDSPYDPIL